MGSIKDKRKVAVYLRVSTWDQTVESQRLAISKYCISHDIPWGEVEVYEDYASGLTDNRKSLERLRADIKADRFRILITWAIDRWTRNIKDEVEMIAELNKHNVVLIALEDNFDLSTPDGEYYFYHCGLLAMRESKRRSARMKACNALKRALGQHCGGVAGRTDKRPRKKDGYFRRYAKIRETQVSLIGEKVDVKALTAQIRKEQKRANDKSSALSLHSLPPQQAVTATTGAKE